MRTASPRVPTAGPRRAAATTFTRARRVAVVAVAVVVAVVALGGCRTIEGTRDTQRALERAGYTEVEVSPFSESLDHLEVVVDPTSSEGGPEGQADQAAGIVWTVFPLRFDHLTVVVTTPEGAVAQLYSYAEMTETFGPRDPSFDESRMSDEATDVFFKVTAALVAVGVVFLGGSALVVILLVRRNRRRSAATVPPWPPTGGVWR